MSRKQNDDDELIESWCVQRKKERQKEIGKKTESLKWKKKNIFFFNGKSTCLELC